VCACVCVCPQIGCRTITSAILYRFSPHFARPSEMWLFRTLLFLRQTGSRLAISEMCKIPFWQFRDCGGHIFPRKNANFGRFEVAFHRPEFDRPRQCLLSIKCILIDYLITLVSVCVSVHKSVVERLRPQFFTDFHHILHAAQKCGCFERYCF